MQVCTQKADASLAASWTSVMSAPEAAGSYRIPLAGVLMLEGTRCHQEVLSARYMLLASQRTPKERYNTEPHSCGQRAERRATVRAAARETSPKSKHQTCFRHTVVPHVSSGRSCGRCLLAQVADHDLVSVRALAADEQGTDATHPPCQGLCT
jgi:hypothetical protein